jgi:elongator complex protein 6
LDKLAAKKRFTFVDGLSGLFLSNQKPNSIAGERVLSNSGLSSVSGEIQQAIKTLQGDGGKIVLVIDQMDLLLAAGGDQVTAGGMGDILMGLREVNRSFC